MSKYINTDDIEYITWSLYNGHDMHGNTLFIERDIVSRQIIDAMPAADVVEVTRCKDCFYAEETEGIIGGTCLYCTHWCKDVDGDTFCSNGFSTISKRRPNNDS